MSHGRDPQQTARSVDESGYFAVGIEHPKTEENVGTLWRTANLLGASFLFTVGHRYRRQPSDTMDSWRRLPLFTFATLDDLWEHLPFTCRVVGVELDDRAVPLASYHHWERAVYLLGAEDYGLSKEALRRCHDLVRLPGERSMNVAVAGSIVLYDRVTRGAVKRRKLEAMQGGAEAARWAHNPEVVSANLTPAINA